MPWPPVSDSGVPSLDEMKALNEGIIKAHRKANPGAFEAVGFNRNSMQDVLDRVEACQDLCAKASVLMCGIAWAQPFSGANKRTAVASAKILLGRHGLDIECSLDGGSGDRLRRLLLEVQGRRACLDHDVVAKTQICVWKSSLRRHAAEPFSAMARRIIEENARLFDYMAKEPPLPAGLSAEEAAAERLVAEWGKGGGGRPPAGEAERILRTENPHAGSFSPETIRMLAGADDGEAAGIQARQAQ